MAKVKEEITLTPTKYGAKNSYVSSYDEFLNGTDNLVFGNSTYNGAIVFYSFDFQQLSSLKELSVESVLINIDCQSTLLTTSSLSIKLVRGFKTSGSSVGTYKDLGDGQLNADLGSGGFVENSFSELPNTLNHIISNIDELISNPDSTEFGIRLYGKRCTIRSIQLVLTCEYEGKISKVHGCTSTKSGYAKEIYVGTTEHSAVYLGTEKIYG